MSLLLNVIFATHARSTHHKLALDALKHLEGDDSAQWADMLISQHSAYLEGAKAPDDDFKDFKNHVLHVRENFWGGAVAATENWYGTLIDHLRGEEWKEASYAAGVLSHYYSDPQMPFHTGQTESEGAVHRAAEWSVTKSYEKLREIIVQDFGGYPTVAAPTTETWLEEMVKDGAVRANVFYELLIDHYNLAAGVKDPPAGLDRTAQEAVARCLAHATIGFARILERAFVESAAVPPVVTLTTKSVLATINVPIRKIVNSLADAKDRQAVEAIYREVQETGKAIESLPESERLVRQFHAAEVRKVSLLVLNAEKPRPAGMKYNQSEPAIRAVTQTKSLPVSNLAKPVVIPAAATPQIVAAPQVATPTVAAPAVVPPAVAPVAKTIPEPPKTTPLIPPRSATPEAITKPASASLPLPKRSSGLRYYLKPEAAIVDAPSIGPKTATRFNSIGMITVDDFLKADPEDTARQLATRHISADVIREWQAQSRLMVTVPSLRGHDAQLLTAAQITDATALRDADAHSLLKAVTDVAATSQGRSILRDSSPPDLDEVRSWINAADQTSSMELMAG